MRKRAHIRRWSYNPAGALSAKDSVRIIDKTTYLTVCIAARQSLHAMQAGTQTQDDLFVLAEALNVTLALAYGGLGADYADGVRGSMVAFAQAAQCIKNGEAVKTALIDPIAASLDLHDEQIRVASIAQLRAGFNLIRELKAAGEVIAV